MSKQIQRRRGSTADHAAFTGAQGEFTYNTDTKRIHAHDGLTAAGFAAARVDELAATGGSGLVGYDGSTVQAVLDNAKPIADYTALRAYTGRAVQVRITTSGIAGFFYYDSADTTSVDNGGTVIVASNGKRWKRLYDGAVNVNWFGVNISNGVTDASYVSQLIANICDSEKKRHLYVPNWGGSFKWVSPVVLINPGVRIFGDQSATYNRGTGKDGWLLGQAELVRFFDLGASRTTGNPADQWQVEGLSLKQAVGVTARTIDGISFTTRTNGPDRGANIRDMSFVGLKDGITIENPDISTVIANLNVEGSVFTACESAVNAKGRVLGFRFVNNQCEQNVGTNGVIRGALDGPVTITDNMLEGQSNAIVFDGNSAGPQAKIENNYLEANSGDYVIKFAPSSAGTATLTLGNNYISPGSYTDFLDFVRGILIENHNKTYQRPTITLASAGSKLSGRFVHKATGAAADVAKICCIAESQHAGRNPIGFVNKATNGGVTAVTPYGVTTNAHSFIGTAGATQGAISGSAFTTSDVVVCVALLKATSSSDVTIGYYNQASVNIMPGAGTHNVLYSASGDPTLNDSYWHIACCAFKPSADGTGVRFRFGSGLSGDLTVAGWGYYVIPAASIYTRNGQPRVDCEIWAPLPVTELRGSVTYDPPSLADGAGVTTTLTITGAALGDYVDSISFSNDTQGVAIVGWVSAANTISISFQNKTGSAVDLASGTLRALVKKA